MFNYMYMPRLKSIIACPKCGGDAEVDTSIVLTSYPAQYSCFCGGCKKTFYILCSELGTKYPVTSMQAVEDELEVESVITTTANSSDEPFVITLPVNNLNEPIQIY